MAKPPVRRQPCDSYTTIVDGVVYHPHEGEWVDVVGEFTVADQLAVAELQRNQVALQAAQGEPDEGAQVAVILEANFRGLCRVLAGHVLGWSLTDATGRPYPQPTTPEVFTLLPDGLFGYLLGLIRGEAADDRKNDSRPSPITSSATASPPTRAASSTTVPSHRRAS